MYVLIIHEIHIIYGKKSFLVLCDSYPGRDLAGRDVGTVVNTGNGRVSAGRDVGTVINITCTGNSYPSSRDSVPGYFPKYRTKLATCKLNKDGKTANWDSIYKCVPGNET